MALEVSTGDILKADAEALVNTVNCVGIMGRGIACELRGLCRGVRRGEVQPGRMFVFETEFLHNPRYIINFPTKRHWRGKRGIDDISSGLQALSSEIRQPLCRRIGDSRRDEVT